MKRELYDGVGMTNAFYDGNSNVSPFAAMPIARVCLVVLSAIAIAISAAAQEDLQYQRRADRYEGVKARPVSGYDVELLSARLLHAEDLGKLGDRLGIRFHLKEDSDVHVVVRELEYKHYYWLDRIVPRTRWRAGFDNQFEWSTREVMKRLRDFRPNELGVVVRVGKSSPSVMERVAPALLYQAQAPSAGTGYLFTFRLRDDGKVTARIFRQGNDEALFKQVFARQDGGRPFSVLWDWGVVNPSPGEYKLVLDGYFRTTNEPIRQSVSFHHPADATPR